MRRLPADLGALINDWEKKFSDRSPRAILWSCRSRSTATIARSWSGN